MRELGQIGADREIGVFIEPAIRSKDVKVWLAQDRPHPTRSAGEVKINVREVPPREVAIYCRGVVPVAVVAAQEDLKMVTNRSCDL